MGCGLTDENNLSEPLSWGLRCCRVRWGACRMLNVQMVRIRCGRM